MAELRQNSTLTLNSGSFSIFYPQGGLFKTLRLFFQLNLLVGSDLIEK